MTALLLAFDVLLAMSLVIIAWRVLASEDLFRAVILFITFGVLMSVCWVRLRAPDLALVEVAIGAGLTGALFLNTWSRIEGEEQSREASQGEET
ncbi:MAG: Na(+)/H(+) antiporter subunit B [Bradymonadaceae bacterium]